MIDTKVLIRENNKVVSNYFLLELEPYNNIGTVKPGQFVMLKIPGNEVFLRRPFSIYDYDDGILTVMYKSIGKGTELLSKTRAGTVTSVLAPLGNGFHINKRDEYLIVAGGIGVAGVCHLLKNMNENKSVFFGCTSHLETALLKDIMKFNPVVSTLDGSFGYKGNVVEILENYLETSEKLDREIFVCGPHGMLKSLKKVIEKNRIPCQVLLEEKMACGLGLCFGCVTKTMDTDEPYKRVCKDGPVFDLWEIYL
ncbi:MAG TPA: diguanylate cyclase [Actinobacteria bacterium]|nr:diguanylate cyclase [Actinomycetota bacterium]